MNEKKIDNAPKCPADCIVQQRMNAELIFLQQTHDELTSQAVWLAGDMAIKTLEQDPDLSPSERIDIVNAWRAEVALKIAETELLIGNHKTQIEDLKQECSGIAETTALKGGFQYVVRLCTSPQVYEQPDDFTVPVDVIRESAN